jgi:iron-sulfur cluster repair protein YtfE (RIC family)
MDLVTQLSNEHRDLLAVITHLQAAADAGDASALARRLIDAQDTLTNELDAHIALEESIVFPAVSGAHGEDLIAVFRDEHREIRALRDQALARAGAGNAPADLVQRLCDLVVAHQQREDLMLFPSARDALDAGELDAPL